MANLYYLKLIFVILGIIVTLVLGTNDDEYYCKQTDDFKICRTCPSLDEDCETAEKCQCDNIELKIQGTHWGRFAS